MDSEQDEFADIEVEWFQTIDDITGRLWIALMGSIVRTLQAHGLDSAFLIPFDFLALLPLHAAWWDEDGERHYALDQISFAYLPSARTLAHARRIVEFAKEDVLLAIDEPKPVSSLSLPYSSAEVLAIKTFFKESIILKNNFARRDTLIQMLPKASVVHFACHGSVNWEYPIKSGLLMANDDIFTINDLHQLNLKGSRFATLSACETGLVGIKLPDEVVSIAAAFMRIGFPGVLASLWAVSDESTAVLMRIFYKLWKEEGLLPVKAIRQAQIEMRNIDGFRHPYYWAAFYLIGI